MLEVLDLRHGRAALRDGVVQGHDLSARSELDQEPDHLVHFLELRKRCLQCIYCQEH